MLLYKVILQTASINAYRKTLQRSGMDYAILLVLPSGAYQYRFIVDGEWRHAHDVPYLSDETGLVNNIVDVHVCISLLFHFFSHTLSLSLSPSLFIILSKDPPLCP